MLMSTQLLAFCMLSLVHELRRGVRMLSNSIRSILHSAAENVTLSALLDITPVSISVYKTK